MAKKGYRRILAAVDFSEASEEALQRAEEIASVCGSDLYLLHVVEEPPALFYADVLADPTVNPLGETPITEMMVENAQKRLLSLGQRYSVPEERCLVVVGSPKREILDEAEKLGVDLIVVGRHGHGFFERLLIGSISNYVVGHADRDVLVVTRRPST